MLSVISITDSAADVVAAAASAPFNYQQ